jgi:hypothetical protein
MPTFLQKIPTLAFTPSGNHDGCLTDHNDLFANFGQSMVLAA